LKKIGITGSTGLLGKLLTKELRNKNKDIGAWYNWNT